MSNRFAILRVTVVLAGFASLLVACGVLASGASATVIIPRPHAPEVEVPLRPAQPVEVEVPRARGSVDAVSSDDVELLDLARVRAVRDADGDLENLRHAAGDLIEQWARRCLSTAFKDAGAAAWQDVSQGTDFSPDHVLKQSFADCFRQFLVAAGVPQQVAQTAGDDLGRILGDRASGAEQDASLVGINGIVYANWLARTGETVAGSDTRTTTSDTTTSATTDASADLSASGVSDTSSDAPSLIVLIAAVVVFGGAGVVILVRRRAGGS